MVIVISAELKSQLSALAPAEQRQVIAFLLSLSSDKDKLTRKIDDNNPAHWVPLEELTRRLSDSAE
jgi:hypothetical protein